MRPWLSPNAITAARMPLAPLAVVAMTWGSTTGLVVAAVLALVLELTDLADGIIARRYRMVSPFGSLFDPFSDAFCRYTLFLGLFAIGVADLWMVVLIFWRDSSVSFFRSIAAVRNVVLAARWSGKVKAVVQGVGTQIVFIALVAAALLPQQGWLVPLPWWTMCAMTAVTMWSFVDYFVGNLPILRAAWDNEPAARPPRP